ncbi:ComEC/Rec2 family competence protein [Cohnella nanjingensis]|uniref:MBL fold metallo-hydrolase n=1 Tax=Cohnella nanjingensis TaxID=1387779 RepID=A0A7X0VGT2_9BACL|nr:MBL fold metallo-hydrolase [Cohnella nanjingensis]MBB6671949.1 MBL fold metallo-hydrolase [Cohnella nanjingensis]
MRRPAQVRFLNVGWGDAHLIRLPSGAVTLIDGGDGIAGPDRDHPLSWMDREGVSRLDWMILTHIHEDHLNGLLDVARRRQVARAVLPYELPPLPFALPDAADGLTAGAARVLRMLAAYEELVRLLREQGTDIRWRSAYGSAGHAVLWEEEDCALAHLYPWAGDPQPGLDALREAVREDGQSFESRLAALEAFFSLSNDDSSVYRLASAADPAGGVLFGGDQVIAGWERLLRRADLRSKVWKVPHHGLEDAFQAGILSAIAPEHGVIPICLDRSLPLRENWDRIQASSDAVLHLTGSCAPGDSVRLADGPIEVWIGG